MSKIDILSLYPQELECEIIAMGERKFRAKQIFEWLHVKKVTKFDEMTDISVEFRRALDDKFCINQLKISKILESEADNTVKYLYELTDKEHVEAVLMEYNYGLSLCISTQVGCKMGCAFCASTLGGLVRNLSASEMLQEYYTICRTLDDKRISGIVLMGIGEPLDNYDNVVRFLRLVCDARGDNFSGRGITLSTCGIVPKIYALADEGLAVTLSVSLHAPNDSKRNEIMPVNRAYPIAGLLEACAYYRKKTGRRVTFEYSIIDGVNSSRAEASELARLLAPLGCHVNLIPVNYVKERGLRSSRKSASDFGKWLGEAGINATVRRTLGSDINAACGQLRRDAEKSAKESSIY